MDCSTPGLSVHHQLLEFTQLMSTESVMPSNYLILCPSPSPPTFSLSQHQGLFKWISSLHQVAEVLEFSFSISPFNEYPGLISFRMDWLDILAVQGTLRSLLQHHSSKASVLQYSAFFIVQLSYLYMTTGKTISLTRWNFTGKVMSLWALLLSHKKKYCWNWMMLLKWVMQLKEVRHREPYAVWQIQT